MSIPVLVTVVETPEFIARIAKLMPDQDRQEPVDDLARHPSAGDLMPGAGGVRKLRWKLLNALRGLTKLLIETYRGEKAMSSKRDYRVHVPTHVDVKAIRTKLGMTQQSFAARFGFSVNTLRHWEQGIREPEGPTRAYLLVIDRAPLVVQKALRIARRQPNGAMPRRVNDEIIAFALPKK